MKMQINDLSRRVIRYKEHIKIAIDRVLDSGWFILGPEVKQFEQSFAHYVGAKYCISVANGTDALELALRALGVKHGDRVATVANAGMYTTTAILAIGAQPFYLDVDLGSKNVTLSEVERAISSGVNAIVVTHLYGLAVPEIRQISKLCAQHDIPLLEDCAQAHGARVEGVHVGTFGTAAAFSFYPTKNLGAIGDGGAVLTSNDVVAERVMRLRQYGWSTKYRVEVSGSRNSRLDEIQAAILSVFLSDLDSTNERRREIARYYSANIKNPEVSVPIHGFGEEYVAHLYVMRSTNRDLLRAHLRDHGIDTDIHYPIPDYRQPLFGNSFETIMLKNTELLCREVLTLPCYPEMTDVQVQQVITAINQWKL